MQIKYDSLTQQSINFQKDRTIYAIQIIILPHLHNQIEQMREQSDHVQPYQTGYEQENCQPNQALQKSQRKIYGTKKATSLLIFFVPLILTAPLVAYHMAIKKKQQHPFPHPTITDTACHYPQDIQFRLIMAGSGPFISFVYFTLFKWMKFQKQRTQYPGTIFSPLYYIGQASVWGFMIAMGTIDGMWYPDLHTNSAIFFFVVLFVIVMTQTLVLRDMYLWDSTVITQKSYLVKVALAVYVALVWVFSLGGLVLFPDPSNDDQNPYIVILEWNSVYVCLFWILSYLPQWKMIRITLTQETKQEHQTLPQNI